MTQLVKRDETIDVPRAERTNSGPTFTPRCDILETENELLLYADLPGCTPEEIELKFENGELWLHGKAPSRRREGTHVYGEYEMGDFYRTFSVYEEIDAEKIAAEYRHGVLTVHLPKTEAVKPKRIEVRCS